MNSRRLRVPSIVAAAMAFSLVAVACGSAAPTPIIIYTTPTPGPTAMPTPEPTATPTPTPTPTPAPSLTQGPSASAAPSATPTPAATPTPGPSGPAGACSGSGSVQELFADAAKTASFAVYCGVVSKPWFFDSGSYGSAGLDIVYCTQTNSGHTCPSGPRIEIKEGPFCTSACSPGSSIGAASFGDLPGQLYSLSGGGFAIYVNPGTAKGYAATGTGGISQATFVNIVKALVKVPKS
ncbi:MAG: hypothetical protein ABSE70_00675 [Candidatus Limnocylindrales bacterium]